MFSDIKLNKMYIILVTVLILTSCSKTAEIEKQEVELILVKTMITQKTPYEDTLSYIGHISPEQVKRLAFKATGKISRINVVKGQKVFRGEILAYMDTTDYQLAKDALYAQLQATIIKSATAKDVYDYTKEQFTNTENLYKEQAVSSDVYEQAKTNLKVKESEMNGALELGKQSQAQYDSMNKTIADSIITASDDGIVAEVLYKENEIVAAGYPVVALRSESQIVTVGVSSKDIDNVSIDMVSNISYLDKNIDGRITYIAEVPNLETLSYDIEITMTDNIFRLGNVVDVQIVTSQKEGVWIPLDVLQYDGKTFVYTIEGNEVKKNKIEIIEEKGSRVLITGIEENTQIISENMSYVKEGSIIKVVNN